MTIGSLLAFILAKIYLSNFENKNIYSYIDIVENFFITNMSMIFMIISANISEIKILNYLNFLHSHLKFTMEERLYFFDVTFRKEYNKIITSVGIENFRIL